MAREPNPTEYSIQLRDNFESFANDFWAEFRNQSTKPNRASERRMRVLLRKFSDRVYKPYKQESLEQTQSGLESILKE